MASTTVTILYVLLYLIIFIVVSLIVLLLYPPTRKKLTRWLRPPAEDSVRKYVQDTLDKGFTLEQIEERMLKSGYQEGQVHDVLDEFRYS